jgi:hypothetical protein
MNLGEIYCVTSPSGKQYVGKCVKLLSGGQKWGYLNRWKDHIRDAKTRNYCRALNYAINKYGHENMKLEVIKECNIDELNYYENYYINSLNTLKPNGYNLTTGGSKSRNSEETKILKRNSMIGKNVGKILPKISRKREEDNHLPKYLLHFIKKNGKEGYRIYHHPTLKPKSFGIQTISLEERLQQALNYLNQIETDK